MILGSRVHGLGFECCGLKFRVQGLILLAMYGFRV